MALLTTSPQGYSVIRSFEGRSLKAYKDEVGVWTIGYGNTNYDAEVLGFEIKAGVTITAAQAEQLLQAAMTRRYEPSVRQAMGPDVTQPAFDAGGSFHYNTGAIKRASWVKSYVAKNLPAVHSQIVQWNKAGGKPLAGLTRRRNREWSMISAGDYGPEGAQTAIRDEKGRLVSGTSTAPQVAPAPVVPLPAPATVSGLQPWHQRMEDILGLYEYPGAENNPCILRMAEQCGGSIAKNYKDDLTAWCALTINWTLITTSFKGSGTLWALDFEKDSAAQHLTGPAVGAIATKPRFDSAGKQIGGHVFVVKGRTADGRLVGTGGNQSDMVCDATFDPKVCKYHWPLGAKLPARVGFATLPVVSVRPHTHKKFDTLPAAGSHPALQNANPPTEVLEGSGMLRKGDKGPEVKDAQEMLVAAGFDIGKDGPDGDFGPSTDKAVRAFQKAHPQLEVTGIMDPATRAALKRDADLRRKTVAQTGKGAGTITAAETVNALSGHHVSLWVMAGIGLVVAGVLCYTAWKYRDEIRAMLLAKAKELTHG